MKIAHASGSETGGINGTAGDQTEKEVCIREWYSKPWNCVLRAKDSKLAQRISDNAIKGANNNHIGYSQATRNSAHAEAKKVGYDLSKINVNCNTDCSAFVTLCCIASGVMQLEYTYNAPCTSNMRRIFLNTGLFEVLTDAKYLNGTQYLKKGDILLKEGKHTAIVIEDAPTTEKTKTVGECYPKYTGTSVSIVTALQSVGEKDASKTHRSKIADKNGILGYSGTAEQNTKMLNLLKAGKLIKA